jgi:hypothetical protein
MEFLAERNSKISGELRLDLVYVLHKQVCMELAGMGNKKAQISLGFCLK